jgi:hypothetical protein
MERCPIPQHQNDLATAALLLSYQGPVSGKDYQRLLVWLKDERWPVFKPVAAFVGKQSGAAQSAINLVLKSHNGSWQKNVIQHVMSTWPPASVAAVAGQLLGMVTNPDLFGPDIVAARLLLRHQLVDTDWLQQWLAFKRNTLSSKVAEISQLLCDLT